MKIKKLLRVLAIIMVLLVFYVPQTAFAGTAPSLTSTEEAFGIKGSVDINIKNKVKDAKYVWTTSNSKIATVDKVGVIKGLKSGDVTITCTITTPDGKTYELSCDVAINSKTKVTVVNQEQLEKALADKAVKQIIIKTAKGREFNIPEGNYSGKRLYLKAPFAEINNEGKFTSVHTYVSNQEQLEKALKDETVTIITIVTGDEESFEIKGNYPSIRVIINAPKSKVINNAILRGVEVKEVKVVEEIEYVKEEAKEKVEEEVKEEIPENSDSSNVPYIPSFPNIPTGPTVPTTPAPTPTVPATPTPEPEEEEDETPATPTEPTLSELDQAKLSAKEEILNAALVKKPYMTHSAWLQYYEGIIIPNMNFINTRTTLGDITSNKNAIVNTINAYEVGSTEYYTNIILPTSYDEINGNPIYTAEQLQALALNDTDEDNLYEFTTVDGKDYAILKSEPLFINNATFSPVNTVVETVSGSAIKIDIIAWNNVNGFNGITGLTRVECDENTNPIGTPIVLVKDEDYSFATENGVDSILITKIDLGNYTYHVSFEVPYLSLTTGNDVSLQITDQ